MHAYSTHNLLIVGATSGIAKPLVRRLAADSIRFGRSAGFILAGRDLDELSRQAADVTTRFDRPAAVLAYDATDLDGVPDFFSRALEALPGGVQELVLCHGWLPDAEAALHDPAVQRRTIDVNYTSAVLLLEQAARHFEAQSDVREGRYAITAITSVAGERGRRSNYPYGATKAALSHYLSGLRSRLHPVGVSVLTVKPGYVDTAMTWGRIRPDSPMNAEPERVANDISRAMRDRKNTIYTPRFWRPVMAGVRAVPEFMFKRMKV